MNLRQIAAFAAALLFVATSAFAQQPKRPLLVALQHPAAPASAPAPAASQTADSDAETKAIREVLTRSAEAWNRADLETYVQAYWKSPDTTFVGGARLTRGYENILAVYKQGYLSPGHEMGKLDYPDITPQFLCSDTALVRGKWHLRLSTGKEPHGIFTLIMKKFPEGWRIIHDHSSVGE